MRVMEFLLMAFSTIAMIGGSILITAISFTACCEVWEQIKEMRKKRSVDKSYSERIKPRLK